MKIKAAKSVGWFGVCIALITTLSIAFLLYFAHNALNPESRFCRYKIYKQPDGTYEVWWSNMTSTREAQFDTYEQAKAFQEERCRSLVGFIGQKPTGELLQ